MSKYRFSILAGFGSVENLLSPRLTTDVFCKLMPVPEANCASARFPIEAPTPRANVPSFTFNLPLNSLLPRNTRVPAPFLSKVPFPLIFDNDVPLSELTVSFPDCPMLVVPEKYFVPSFRTIPPLLILAVPVNLELSPVNVISLPPSLFSVPFPLKVPVVISLSSLVMVAASPSAIFVLPEIYVSSAEF